MKWRCCSCYWRHRGEIWENFYCRTWEGMENRKVIINFLLESMYLEEVKRRERKMKEREEGRPLRKTEKERKKKKR